MQLAKHNHGDTENETQICIKATYVGATSVPSRLSSWPPSRSFFSKHALTRRTRNVASDRLQVITMPKRNKHTLSHYRLLTGDMGFLLPIGVVEALPADTINHSTSLFMRMSPMAAPVMHPIDVRLHHFFVPNRLTWPKDDVTDGWEAFITGGPDGNNAETVPTIDTTGTTNDLLDYMGLPVVPGVPISALPLRAINQIYNYWYRDQDLATERAIEDTTLPQIAWGKDYFTMARPWPQKGPDVTLPLGAQAPVKGIGVQEAGTYSEASAAFHEAQGTDATYAAWQNAAGGLPVALGVEEDPLNPNYPNIYADLSAATALNVNELRKLFAQQRLQEARARYGSRYSEYLRYLGAFPRDSRLQNPEFLGGGKARVAISEVLQVSDTTGTESERYGVGDMYGHGVAAMRSNSYRRTIDEHGYIISMLSVRPAGMYMNGINRTYLRRNKDDFWQKELQHIGQQEIWDAELFASPAMPEPDMYSTFGWADRYREYREQPSRVSAEYKDVLKYWHLARDFSTAPVLNQSFTDCDASKRIFNVQTTHGLWMAAQHKIVARRLVTRNAAPRIF